MAPSDTKKKADKQARRKARREAKKKQSPPYVHGLYIVASRIWPANEPYLEATCKKFREDFGLLPRQVRPIDQQGKLIPGKLLVLGIKKTHTREEMDAVVEAYQAGELKGLIHDEQGFCYMGQPFLGL